MIIKIFSKIIKYNNNKKNIAIILLPILFTRNFKNIRINNTKNVNKWHKNIIYEISSNNRLSELDVKLSDILLYLDEYHWNRINGTTSRRFPCNIIKDQYNIAWKYFIKLSC